MINKGAGGLGIVTAAIAYYVGASELIPREAGYVAASRTIGTFQLTFHQLLHPPRVPASQARLGGWSVYTSFLSGFGYHFTVLFHLYLNCKCAQNALSPSLLLLSSSLNHNPFDSSSVSVPKISLIGRAVRLDSWTLFHIDRILLLASVLCLCDQRGYSDRCPLWLFASTVCFLLLFCS